MLRQHAQSMENLFGRIVQLTKTVMIPDLTFLQTSRHVVPSACRPMRTPGVSRRFLSKNSSVWRIKPYLKLGPPSLVERLELSALTDSIPRAARVEAVTVSPTLAVRIPPYSLTDFIWYSRLRELRGHHREVR